MQLQKEYLYNADFIRVAAIIGVVIIHVTTTSVGYSPYFFGISWWIINLLDSFTRVAVPLFVMLSGYLILKSTKTTFNRAYFKKRFIRIVPILIIWSAIYLMWDIFYWSKNFTTGEILQAFFTPNIYYHLYFLYIILGLYLASPLLKLILKKLSKTNLVILISIMFVIDLSLSIFDVFFLNDRVLFNSLSFFLPYIPYFLAGYYLIDKKSQGKNLRWLVLAYFIFSLATSILNYWYIKFTGRTNSYYFYEHFSPNIVIMSLISFMILNSVVTDFSLVKNQLITRIVKLLAPLTFGIYLIHPLVYDLINNFVPILSLYYLPSKFIILAVLLKIVLIFILSLTIVYIGKKIKFLSFIWG